MIRTSETCGPPDHPIRGTSDSSQTPTSDVGPKLLEAPKRKAALALPELTLQEMYHAVTFEDM